MVPLEGKIDVLDLMLVPGIRGGTIRRLLEHKAKQGWTWAEFWATAAEDLRREFHLRPESARVIACQRDWLVSERERILKRLHCISAGILFCEEAGYPKELRTMKDYPPLLFYKGNLELLSRRKVGVLSSRNPSWRDVALVGQMVVTLRETGAALVSGAGAIQHYVPGYWALLAEVPVIWVLDRGLLMALESGSHGHIAPFARMDGRLWREEMELGLSAFSPEDVGTPGGMRLRDRLVAYLSDDLAGWGIRKRGNAMKALQERYDQGARVIIATRGLKAPSNHNRPNSIPILVVDEGAENWRNWLLRSRRAHPELDQDLVHYLGTVLSERGNTVIIDFFLNKDECLPLTGREGLPGTLWIRNEPDDGQAECDVRARRDVLKLNDRDGAELEKAHKVVVLTGPWGEFVEVSDIEDEQFRRWKQYAPSGNNRMSEPVRDYRPQSAVDYRRVHKKMLEIWRREVIGKATISHERYKIPRPIAVIAQIENRLPLDADLLWLSPIGGRPAWVDKVAAGFGMTKADGLGYFEGWELWIRMGKILENS